MARAAWRSSSPCRSWAARRPTSAATSAGGPLTAPSGWTTTSAPSGYNAQVPRPLRASVVGMPSGTSIRRNRDAGARTPSSATGRSPSYRILPGG
jgi:hypothetical protein